MEITFSATPSNPVPLQKAVNLDRGLLAQHLVLDFPEQRQPRFFRPVMNFSTFEGFDTIQ